MNPYILPAHWPTQSLDVSPHPVGRDAAMRLGISPLSDVDTDRALNAWADIAHDPKAREALIADIGWYFDEQERTWPQVTVKGARDVLALHHMAHTLIQPLADVISPHVEATAAMHGVELFPIQMLLVRWRLDLGVDGRTVVQAARYTGAHLLALARMQSFLAERPDGAVWRALVAQEGVLPEDGLARLGISLGEADWLYGPWLDPATARVELERRLHAMQRRKYRRLSVEDLLDSLSQVFLERTPSHDGVDTAARLFTTALSGDFIRTLDYRALDTIEALNVRTKGRAQLKVARETPLTAREVEDAALDAATAPEDDDLPVLQFIGPAIEAATRRATQPNHRTILDYYRTPAGRTRLISHLAGARETTPVARATGRPPYEVRYVTEGLADLVHELRAQYAGIHRPRT